MKQILFFISLFVSLVGTAQIVEESSNPCLNYLKQAEEMYKFGNIEEVPSLIKKCVDDKQFDSQADEETALRLLVDSYIYDLEPDSADYYMVKLLQSNPEFVPNPTIDRKEFIDLHDNFVTNPVFGVGVRASVNTSLIQNIEQINAYAESTEKSKYIPGVGFDAAACFTYYPSWNLAVDADLGFNQISFVDSTVTMPASSLNNSSVFATSGSQFKLQSIYANIGFSYLLGHSLERKSFFSIRPHFTAGLVVSAKGNTSRGYSSNIPENSARDIPEDQNVDVDNLFRVFTMSAGLELGFNVRVKKGRLNFFVNYDYQITEMQSDDYYAGMTEQQSTLNDYLFQNYGVMNRIRPHKLSLGVAYTYHFYKPRKKETKRSYEVE